MHQQFQVSTYGKRNCKQAGPDGGKKARLKRADAKTALFFFAATRAFAGEP
jgi:hypothetical protein